MNIQNTSDCVLLTYLHIKYLKANDYNFLNFCRKNRISSYIYNFVTYVFLKKKSNEGISLQFGEDKNIFINIYQYKICETSTEQSYLDRIDLKNLDENDFIEALEKIIKKYLHAELSN